MKPLHCATCRKPLRLGDEITLISEGVVAHQGPLTTQEAKVCCSNACARAHLPEDVRMPERVP